MWALRRADRFADAPVDVALSVAYSQAVQWMKAEDREEFDGWMTCTLPQAMEFLGDKDREAMAERLRVAKMLGGE